MENSNQETSTTGNIIDPILLEALHRLETEPRETRQRFRRVYRNQPNASTNGPQGKEEEEEIFYIAPEYDPVLERNVIYWRQIEETFQNALYIWDNFNIVYFNQDYDNKNILPLSINTVLEVVLDVILENPVEGSENDNESTNQPTISYQTAAANRKDCPEYNSNSRPASVATSTDPQETQPGKTQEADDFSTIQSQSRRYGRGLTLTKAKGGKAESQTDVGIIYFIFIEDYSKSMEWFLKAANQGFALAQRLIGYMYFIGYGDFTKNISTSLEWALKSAEQGDAVGENLVGVIYNDGVGGDDEGAEAEKDFPRAMDWYMKAGNQGYSRAQRNIANLYVQGHGVQKDYSKALEWFIKASKQGHAMSHNDIGVMYNEGLGLAEDATKALEWYQRAASQGETYSQNNIGGMYYEGTIFPEDHLMAIKWYQKSANQGNSGAQIILGNMYYGDIESLTDYSKALWWFQKAAENGDPDGQLNMGVLYHNGHAVDTDYKKAREWYLKAAKQGCNIAKTNIGILHHNDGEYLEAIKWYTDAANGGDVELMFKIGEIYQYSSEGEYKNLLNAFEWYTKAAKNGHASGQRCLGTMYRDGEGISRDYSKALEWYLKAALQGDSNSQYEVGSFYYNGNVPLDYHKALDYFLMAAMTEENVDMYLHQVVNCYTEGYGTPVDLLKAKDWIAKAYSSEDLPIKIILAEKKCTYFHMK